MANKTFCKPHKFYKGCNWYVFVYTTQRDYTVRCKSHLTAKKHTRGEGKQGGSKVKFMSVCASDRCQIAVAKKKKK